MRKPCKRNEELKPYLVRRTSVEEQEEMIRSRHMAFLKGKGFDPDHDLIPEGFEEPTTELKKLHKAISESGYDPDSEELWKYSKSIGPLHSSSGLVTVADGNITSVVTTIDTVINLEES